MLRSYVDYIIFLVANDSGLETAYMRVYMIAPRRFDLRP